MLFLFPLLFALAGIASISVGLRRAGAGVRFRRRAIRVTGVVTEITAEPQRRRDWLDGPRAPLHRPVVRFRTIVGAEIETAAATASSLEALRPGDTVGVLYDPDDPTRAQVARSSTSEVAAVLTTTLGGAALLGVSLLSLGGAAFTSSLVDPARGNGALERRSSATVRPTRHHGLTDGPSLGGSAFGQPRIGGASTGRSSLGGSGMRGWSRSR